MSGPRRRWVVDVAERLDFPILEDDFVGGLRYDGQSLPPLKTLARHGNVIYTGTFSKMLAPGLCTGFLAAEGPVLQRILERKSLLGLSSSRMFQRGIAEFIGIGSYRNHMRRSIRLFRQRRDLMISALTEALPDTQFLRPSGGIFIWLRLPLPLEIPPFREACTQVGVRVALGRDFFVEPEEESDHYLRLNFAQNPAAKNERLVKGKINPDDYGSGMAAPSLRGSDAP